MPSFFLGHQTGRIHTGEGAGTGERPAIEILMYAAACLHRMAPAEHVQQIKPTQRCWCGLNRPYGECHRKRDMLLSEGPVANALLCPC